MSSLKRLLAVGLAAAVPWVATAAPALAAKPWSIEYESSVEATNNLQQQANGTPDLAFRNNLQFSYYPTADNNSAALFRLQVLDQRYKFNPDYDSTYLIATGLASRRLYQSLFGYGGYQFLYKQADQLDTSARKDNDLFGGLVFYTPLSRSMLIFHGYQFDYLRADDVTTSYQGHSLYLTWRDLLTDRLTTEVSVRSQLRLFDTIGELEWRNFLSLDASYQLQSWWSLESEALYMNSTASRADFNFNAWIVDVYTRFTY
ncbi:MAG TPA: hypothetical protein V6D47_04805 [Oscillatoriaceae cyanobacterium]